jgi:hypothetical protein
MKCPGHLADGACICEFLSVSGTLSPVKLDLNKAFPSKTKAQILVLEPSHLLVIPEADENVVDFSRMSLIDCTNPLVPTVTDLNMEIPGMPLQVWHLKSPPLKSPPRLPTLTT